MKIHLKNFSYHLPTFSKPLFEMSDLSIDSGQKILIQGPSGCGKSSFLHAIAGLIPACQGEVWYDEVQLLALSSADRSQFRHANLGLIFQRLSLLPQWSALENLRVVQHDRVRARKGLKTLGLDIDMDLAVEHLSWGETQRVSIARALVKDFRVLLADEPTSSLDDDSTLVVMRELIRVTERKTFICVSHDHRVEKYFDKILKLSPKSSSGSPSTTAKESP